MVCKSDYEHIIGALPTMSGFGYIGVCFHSRLWTILSFFCTWTYVQIEQLQFRNHTSLAKQLCKKLMPRKRVNPPTLLGIFLFLFLSLNSSYIFHCAQNISMIIIILSSLSLISMPQSLPISLGQWQVKKQTMPIKIMAIMSMMVIFTTFQIRKLQAVAITTLKNNNACKVPQVLPPPPCALSNCRMALPTISMVAFLANAHLNTLLI